MGHQLTGAGPVLGWPRVLSYPPRHPYVDRLDGPTVRLVHRDEPMPDLPRFHCPEWIADHSADYDIAHFHFGYDRRPLDQLRAVVRAHRTAGAAVVFTIHDLAVPDPTPDGVHPLELLRAVSPLVSAVLTLTPGCAAVLEEALDRPVRVVPHGPLLGATTRQRLRSHRRRLPVEGRSLLLHAGRLRANLAWEETIDAVARCDSDARLRVHVHADHVDRVLDRAVGNERVTVVPYRDMAEADLARAIADASALVLPLHWGTHSGMLEMASDIGTPVIASDIGFLSDQQPLIAVPTRDGAVDVDGLAAAFDAPLPTRPMVRECDRERDQHAFDSHHSRLYHRLLLGRPATTVCGTTSAHTGVEWSRTSRPPALRDSGRLHQRVSTEG